MKKSILIVFSALVLLVPIIVHSIEKSKKEALEARIKALELRVANLEAKQSFIRVEKNPINGLTGPHLIVEGANVHIRSGSGSTTDNVPFGKSLTGLGNLVVGYNEILETQLISRKGSHNLIIGPWHSFSSYGGLVAGSNNSVSAPFASIKGGSYNLAKGKYSSISGGSGNKTGGQHSSVSGGGNNIANGLYSSISGGNENMASNLNSSITGGWGNVADGVYSSVTGGSNNTASGYFSTCTGGHDKVVLGY